MKYGILIAISYIIAMLLLLAFAITDDIYFGVGAIIFVMLSSEFSILGAIEKTKEGR